jgi:hypothetical protein
MVPKSWGVGGVGENEVCHSHVLETMSPKLLFGV